MEVRLVILISKSMYCCHSINLINFEINTTNPTFISGHYWTLWYDLHLHNFQSQHNNLTIPGVEN